MSGEGGGVKQPSMEKDRPPPSTPDVKNKWIYTPTPAIQLLVLHRVNFTCLSLRPHIGSVAPAALRAAHTDVQFCTADTHRCAGLSL